MAMAMAGSVTESEVVLGALSRERGLLSRSRSASLLGASSFQITRPNAGRSGSVGSCICFSLRYSNAGSSASEAVRVTRCTAEQSQLATTVEPVKTNLNPSRRMAMVSLLAAITASTPQSASAAADDRQSSDTPPTTSPRTGRSSSHADLLSSKTIFTPLGQDYLNRAVLLATLPIFMKFWNHPSSVPELAYAGADHGGEVRSRHEEPSSEEFKAPTFLMSNGPDMKEQIREMKAAEQRWKQQVRDGRIKSLSPKEAGYAIQLSSSVLLDVRPSFERNKSWVKNSVWVPAFEVDRGMDPGTLMKKFSAFTMGGWWEGTALMKRNERFMADVVARIPKDANVIVSCQKGLRSLAACEQLLKVGYKNVSWLNGGYDAAEDGDFETEGSQPLKFAGIGGMSEFLGWTDVQRLQAAKEGIGYRLMLFGRLALVIAAADALLVGAQKLNEVLRH
ncbi:hypothetical protein CBR_g34898 [Chara braunii]|uniref:Rhodanese domain-containing protein n=1 Tax=Chara braunii TaxID=69332 RepID=A0A388LJU1_CHABU|nr:hypothetical protein CBR_g34898 [Chara braunii]|eukprot:GBG82521.1 hypothetical protein CBR_g34898 [Chara braunii]